jgi:hypothetical protein
MNAATQSALKAQGQISCTHGVRHIRQTNLPLNLWLTREDGSHCAVYCRKCDPLLGRRYENMRDDARERAAERTAAAKKAAELGIDLSGVNSQRKDNA